MAQIHSEDSVVVHFSSASWRDYYLLTKPKVVALLILTAWVGMAMAQPGLPNIVLVSLASLGIALLSASAAAFNHILDQKIDAQMIRTQMRPLANGRLSRGQATIFSLTLAIVGFLVLLIGVNPVTAYLTLASLFGYAIVYTLLLKRATPQNIAIGGLAGAMPPLLGWSAMSGGLDANALLLVMIVFAWTPPHFWALAIQRRDEYAKVNIPMLPVTHGVEFTKTIILFYCILLWPITSLAYLTGMCGLIYLLGSCYLNWRFVHYAWQLKFNPDTDSAMATFRFSIRYLLLLFLLLLLDHYLKLPFTI